MSVPVLPSALDTVDSHNTDPSILCPFGVASAYHNKADLFPWAPWVFRHLSQQDGPTMGLERLYLVHQPVGYYSVHDLFQHSVVAAVVGVDYVEEVHPPGAFQIHWIVESVAPEEEVAHVSAPALVLAEAHPPDVVHPRIHSPLAIRHGHKAAARRMGCSTSYSSPSAASCNASLPVG